MHVNSQITQADGDCDYHVIEQKYDTQSLTLCWLNTQIKLGGMQHNQSSIYEEPKRSS